MDRLALRRLTRLRGLPRAASIETSAHRLFSSTTVCSSSVLPRIAQPSFWRSLIPKPLRGHANEVTDPNAPKRVKSKEWNPATFFICIFLFIGSMSIQMIALKQDFAAFIRRSDVRIGLLREVVEKLQKGEDVDVEKVLGTGDAEREAEWERVIRDIERDNGSQRQKKKKKPKQEVPEEQKEPSPEAADPDPKGGPVQDPKPEPVRTTGSVNTSSFF